MNKRLLNLPFKTEKQKQEIIDFKTFCAGGSPEYIRAKKILAECGLSNKGATKLGPALNSKNNAKSYSVANGKSRSLNAYSLYINPLAFFDINFLLIGASIVAVALLERTLAHYGMISIASLLSSSLRILFPVVACGAIIYLIAHSGFLF